MGQNKEIEITPEMEELLKLAPAPNSKENTTGAPETRKSDRKCCLDDFLERPLGDKEEREQKEPTKLTPEEIKELLELAGRGYVRYVLIKEPPDVTVDIGEPQTSADCELVVAAIAEAIRERVNDSPRSPHGAGAMKAGSFEKGVQR